MMNGPDYDRERMLNELLLGGPVLRQRLKSAHARWAESVCAKGVFESLDEITAEGVHQGWMFGLGPIDRVIEDHFDTLPRPHPALLSEVDALAIAHLSVSPPLFDSAYARFQSAWMSLYTPIPLGLTVEDLVERESDFHLIDLGFVSDLNAAAIPCLFELPSRLVVQANVAGSRGEAFDPPGFHEGFSRRAELSWRIRGLCTAAAMNRAVGDVADVLPAFLYIAQETDRLVLDKAGRRHRAEVIQVEGSPTRMQPLAHAYFGQASTSDSLDRRIQNAVRLFARAFNEPSAALKVALACGALEAMLGKGPQEISQRIAESSATLLAPPESAERLAAMKQVKDLYAIRSRALHGDNLDAPELTANRAILLAARTLGVLLNWKDWLVRYDGPRDGRDEFFKELEDARVGCKRIIGSGDELDCLPFPTT